MISLANTILVAAISIIFGYILAKARRNGKKHLPGPFSYPFVGNLFSLDSHPHVTTSKWAEQAIVISDAALIKKAFQHPDFTGRQKMEVMEHYTGERGIGASVGQEWQDQRRFALRHLRDFGFGKNYMESLITDETTEFVNNLKENEGKSICLNRSFSMAVLNSLWKILTGKRFSQMDPELNQVFDQLINGLRGVNAPLAVFLPKLAKLFPSWSSWDKLVGVLQKNVQFIQNLIREHEEEKSKEGDKNNDDESPKDFIDAYKAEIKKTTDPESSFYGERGVESLTAVVTNLFDAGSMTTSTTLSWFILYMVKFPEVQRKLQDEIDAVLGKHQKPSLADRSRMPYTESVIHEVLRKSSLAPLGVFHESTKDTLFEGYKIEKGTAIVPNLHYCHHDPSVWGDPLNFRPERFLSSDGTKFEKNETLMPFSTGKRVCIGESLAKDTIFLFATSIFQRFDIKADPALPSPSLEPVSIFEIIEPQEFFVIAKDRLEA